MSKLSNDVLEGMFHDEVRVGEIIHIRGMLADCESPADVIEKFIDDEAYDQCKTFEPQWPGYTEVMKAMVAQWEEERKEDRRGADRMFKCEVADLFYRRCPFVFLIAIEATNGECVQADPKGECLGTWRSGWGYYQRRWYLSNSIEDAVSAGLAWQRERKIESWKKALAAKPKAKCPSTT